MEPCAFNGRRIVTFARGGQGDDAPLLDEIRAIHVGGGFGSIIGRNAFRRSKADAVGLQGLLADIDAGKEG